MGRERPVGAVASSVLVAVMALSLSIAPASPAWASGWVVQPSPDGSTGYNPLRSVAAISPTDAWAVGVYSDYGDNHGRVLIEHWNGKTWKVEPGVNPGLQTSTLFGVAGTSRTDVWAVGDYLDVGARCPEPGLIEHWNGRKWKVVPSPNPRECTNLNGVDAISPDDAWAVGAAFDDNGGRVGLPLAEHWDGSAWTVRIQGLPEEFGLYSVSAVASDDVWAVGDALAARWDGTSWTDIHPLPHSPGGYTIAAIASDDVWVAGSLDRGHGLETYTQHWDGTSWNVVPSPSRGRQPYDFLSGIAAAGPADVWAVGSWASVDPFVFHPLILHWNGAQWSIQHSPDGSTDSYLNGAAALPASNTAWAVGEISGQYGHSSTLVEFHYG
jgi:hypothetical protein